MTIGKVCEKIDNNQYKNTDPYPKWEDFKPGPDEDTTNAKAAAKEAYSTARKEWWEIDNTLTKEFISDLGLATKSEYGFTNIETAKRIVEYAWEEGHSNGFSEVVIYAETAAELVSGCFKLEQA